MLEYFFLLNYIEILIVGVLKLNLRLNLELDYY